MSSSGFTVPIRKPSESNDASRGLRDIQEQSGKLFGRVLTVSSVQQPPLPTTGIRLFKTSDETTDILELRSGADNVVPHALGVVIKEAFVTPVGGTAVSFGWSLKDPATVAGLPKELDATKVVCLRVTVSVSARVRVRG